MSKIWLLTKVSLMSSLGINQALKSHNKSDSRNMRRNLTSFIICCLAMIIYSLIFAIPLSKEEGGAYYIPTLSLLVISVTVFLFSFMRAGNDLFNMKTYERVIVLPFSPYQIISSRFLAILLENEAYSLCSFVPCFIIYCLNTTTTFSTYAIALLIVLLIPLFALTLASFLGTLFTSLFAKLKHRNIITSIISLIFLVGIVAASIYLSNKTSDIENGTHYAASAKNLNSYFFLFDFFCKALAGDWLYFLYFALVSLGIYGLFVAFCSWRFIPICMALQKSYSRSQFKMSSQKEGKPLRAFFRKDLKMYLNSRAYLINTIFGYVLIFIGAILIAVFHNSIPSYLTTLFGEASSFVMAPLFNVAIPVMAGLSTIWSAITTISLSYEGKQWWISETMPVRSKTIYDSKLLLNFAVGAPFCLVSLILYFSTCYQYLSAWGYVYSILYPVTYIIFGAVLGLAINIRYPRFNWNSETDLVKTSGSVAFTLLSGLIVAVPPLLAAFLIKNYANYFLLPFALLLLLFSYFLYRHIIKRPLQSIEND
jgi:ABC-2 type transport system permease protein